MEGGKRAFGEPFQISLSAYMLCAGPTVGSKEVHAFTGVDVGDKCNNAAKPVTLECQPGFLANLSQKTVLRAFPVTEFSANANPFVAVFVMLLFGAVEQEIAIPVFQITESGQLHHMTIPF